MKKMDNTMSFCFGFTGQLLTSDIVCSLGMLH